MICGGEVEGVIQHQCIEFSPHNVGPCFVSGLRGKESGLN